MTSIRDDQQTVEAQLLARKKDLEEMIAAGKDEGKPVELDQTRIGRLSRMDALQQQAMIPNRRPRNERLSIYHQTEKPAVERPRPAAPCVL